MNFNSFRTVSLMFMAAGLAVSTASAQISTVELANTTSNPQWQQWDTIWGSGFPTASDTFVFVQYPALLSYGYGLGVSEISSSSPGQTPWWYDGSTQINFWAFATSTYDSTPLGGCVYAPYYPTYTNCDEIAVCESGLCTAAWKGVLGGNIT